VLLQALIQVCCAANVVFAISTLKDVSVGGGHFLLVVVALRQAQGP